eukprot:1197015-Rhodomonas_salina.3
MPREGAASGRKGRARAPSRERPRDTLPKLLSLVLSISASVTQSGHRRGQEVWRPSAHGPPERQR